MIGGTVGGGSYWARSLVSWTWVGGGCVPNDCVGTGLVALGPEACAWSGAGGASVVVL